MAKVTFDGPNKLILVNTGITELDFRQDVYSEWKAWTRLSDNLKYAQALRVVGGDPISDTQQLGATFFLINGWKMRTWEGNHRLTVSGNVYCDDGTSQFVPTLGTWTVLINLRVSNLIDQVYSDGGSPASPEQIAASVWSAQANDNLTAGSMGEALALARGLTQHNFLMDETVYTDKILTSARVRIFRSSADAVAGTNPIAIYRMLATVAAGRVATYRMVRE